jgi:hypothetical protein
MLWRIRWDRQVTCMGRRGVHIAKEICNIWGFYGGDYEECRLLGFKTLVRTSQDTHYSSATDPSRLMLCKIWGFHGGDYEECHRLWYDAVWLS